MDWEDKDEEMFGDNSMEMDNIEGEHTGLDKDDLVLPLKTAKTVSTSSGCVIHCSNDNTALVTLSSKDSWDTLLNAAVIRDHHVILELAKTVAEGDFPLIKYHRTCRSIFTMKSKLLAIKNNSSDNSKLVPQRSMSSNLRPSTSSHSSYLLPDLCIFCDKLSKYTPGTKTREKLVKCIDLRACASIKESAVSRNDSKMLGLVLTKDLVAAEGKYHRSCYKKYTFNKPASSTHSGQEELLDEDSDSLYSKTEESAFQELIVYLNDLRANLCVIRFTDITNRYVMSFKEHGIDEIKPHTKKNLRRKIEGAFGSSFNFVMSDERRLLMYPVSLSIEELARQNDKLQTELEELKSCTSTSDIILASLKLRKDIKEVEGIQSWPPCIEEMSNFESKIPESVYIFLQTLLCGVGKKSSNITSRVSQYIWSFGQDFIHAVTDGRVKTQRHIIIPFALKSLSGSVVELTRLLNRCGHSLSYSVIEEIETAAAMTKISAGRYIVLPRNIIPKQFVHLAWDNIDRLEETLSGGGTSHRVNRIITQFIPPATTPVAPVSPLVAQAPPSMGPAPPSVGPAPPSAGPALPLVGPAPPSVGTAKKKEASNPNRQLRRHPPVQSRAENWSKGFSKR